MQDPIQVGNAIRDTAATVSPSLYIQQVGRATRVGTFEHNSATAAFHHAEVAAFNGYPVKLGKEPGKNWAVTVEPRQ